MGMMRAAGSVDLRAARKEMRSAVELVDKKGGEKAAWMAVSRDTRMVGPLVVERAAISAVKKAELLAEMTVVAKVETTVVAKAVCSDNYSVGY